MAEDEEPGDYIEQRQDLHDCFFLVGRNKEKISTVRYFLANYSSYFRAMLLETDMREKNSRENIVIPDHEPDVFRLMLSFVYGRHDIKFKDVNQAMRFHILVDKCLMPKLKKISTKYLTENCKRNLCEILECTVLLDIKEMEPRAKTIVEKDTRALLSSPDFLNANPAIVEFIVKQEGLNATEVELWRALVKWAERQCGNRKEGNVLRKKIDNFIKHVQFLKMSLKEFAETVVPTAILTPSETITIFVNMATGKGKKITESPSKTRHASIHTACEISLLFEGNKVVPNRFVDTWICVYEISNISPTPVMISKMELTDVLPATMRDWNGGYGGRNNGNEICIKLYDQNYQEVSSLNFPITNNTFPKILEELEFSRNSIMEAYRNYILMVSNSRSQITNSRSNRSRNVMGNQTYNYRIAGVELCVRSCDFCNVELVSSSFSHPSLGKASIIKSLTVTVVDS